MTRKLVCLIFAACLFLAMSADAFATEKQTVIKVGIFDYEKYYGTDAQGNKYGYGYDYLDMLAQYGNFKYEYIYGSWSECLTMLENGTIDMLDSAQKSDERLNKFIFSDYSTGTSYGELFVRADNSDIAYNDFVSMRGISVGMLKDNSRNETFLKFAQENQFTVKTKIYDTEAQLSSALQTAQVDAIVSSNLRKGENERAAARFSPTPFYLMFGRENLQLKSQVDEALEKIQVDNPNYNAQLMAKYYDLDGTAPAFTREEQEMIAKSPVLRAAYVDNWQPFSKYDATFGTAKGINIDVLNLIGKKTGLSFDFIRCGTQQQAADMIAKGEADLLMSVEASDKKLEKLGLTATDCFMSVPLCIVGKDANIKEDAVFIVPESSEEMLWVLEGQFPQSAITVLNTAQECYDAVINNRADYTLDNIYTATNMTSSDYGRDLHIAFVSPVKDYYAIGLKSDADKTLINILNKGIASVSQTEITSVFTNHTVNSKTGHTLSSFFYKYRVIIIIFFVMLLAMLAAVLFVIIRTRKKNKKRIWENIYKDSLTGMGTVKLFEKELREQLDKNKDTKYVLCKMDIENLKIFNDIYGFECGDVVLKLLAKELNTISNPHFDACARIGGDNFIILKSYTKLEDNKRLLHESENRIREAINKEFNYLINLKFGMYYIVDNTESVSSILEKANYAHSVCKASTTANKHMYFDSDREIAVEEKKIESRMEDALEQEQFLLYLQPKFRLSDESLAGAEALVRWAGGENGELLYPNKFIPLFEKNGFITKLDMYMLKSVCELIKGWIDKGQEPTTVSINFSRLHLLNPNFSSEICSMADSYEIPHKYIEVELTESAMFDNESAMFDVLQRLHEEGFTLSMDDFGTGYSSLGLLKNLPVDVIKIDRSFFIDSRFKTRARAVIENVMQMAKRLEIHTVAEGVESQEHIDMLKDMGCDIVQGYFYSKPVPASEFKLNEKGHADKEVFMHPHIEKKDIGNISLGRMDLGETTSVYAYRLFQASMRKTLEDMYGEGEMQFALQNIGKLAGEMFAREMLDVSMPFSDFLLQIGDRLEELKIGIMTVEQVDLENLGAVVKLSNDLDCSGIENCGETLCQYDEGFFAGIMKEYAQRNYAVTETDCWGTGEGFCRFEIKLK